MAGMVVSGKARPLGREPIGPLQEAAPGERKTGGRLPFEARAAKDLRSTGAGARRTPSKAKGGPGSWQQR